MVQLANSNGCSVFEILTLHVSYTYLQNEVLYLIIFRANLVLKKKPTFVFVKLPSIFPLAVKFILTLNLPQKNNNYYNIISYYHGRNI